jgi:putative redox protein
MVMTATARRVGDGLRQEIDVNGRHSIVTDEPEGLGGEDTGPSPRELLSAAVAACVSTMIAMCARRKGWELHGLAVTVDHENEADPPTYTLTIQTDDELTEDQLERLTRVARSCPARRSLEAAPRFEERFVVARASAAGRP